MLKLLSCPKFHFTRSTNWPRLKTCAKYRRRMIDNVVYFTPKFPLSFRRGRCCPQKRLSSLSVLRTSAKQWSQVVRTTWLMQKNTDLIKRFLTSRLMFVSINSLSLLCSSRDSSYSSYQSASGSSRRSSLALGGLSAMIRSSTPSRGEDLPSLRKSRSRRSSVSSDLSIVEQLKENVEEVQVMLLSSRIWARSW